MSTISNAIAEGVLASGALTTIYTGVTGVKARVLQATICNPTGAVVNATLALNARSGGTDRTLLSAEPLAAGGTRVLYELLNAIIESGGLIKLQGNGLAYYISGALVTERP